MALSRQRGLSLARLYPLCPSFGQQRSFFVSKMERSYGSFSRTIPLPLEVETDKIESKFSKGVLSITLPKTVKAVEETKKSL